MTYEGMTNEDLQADNRRLRWIVERMESYLQSEQLCYEYAASEARRRGEQFGAVIAGTQAGVFAAAGAKLRGLIISPSGGAPEACMQCHQRPAEYDYQDGRALCAQCVQDETARHNEQRRGYTDQDVL
jgi:hypothetical protein